MRRKKAKPGDEELVYSESEDWVERSSALSRLAADGRMDLEPVARQWLTSDDHDLSGEALNMLLTYWSDSPRAHEYVATAIEWLATAEDPEMRAQAAACMGSFMSLQPLFHDEILPALLRGLERDEDDIVQETCYEELLKYVDFDEAQKLDIPPGRPFDPSADVRWDLLEPLRRRLAR